MTLLRDKSILLFILNYLWEGRGLLDGVHGELPDILLRMEHDDVELGAVETHKSDVGAQADGDAQGGHLDLPRV